MKEKVDLVYLFEIPNSNIQPSVPSTVQIRDHKLNDKVRHNVNVSD